MNRDHVGMIFKFLPPNEQEELRNLRPCDMEMFSKGSWLEVCGNGVITTEDENYAFRPKGFESWNEIHSEFERKFKGKKITLRAGDFDSILEFDGWKSKMSFRTKNNRGCWVIYPSEKGYGWKVAR